MLASLLFCSYLNALNTIVFASMSQDFCGRVFNTRVGKFQSQPDFYLFANLLKVESAAGTCQI